MKVKYLDLKTGRKAEDRGISEYQLTEGNYSCDCNREAPFGEDSKICKSNRYVVYDIVLELGENYNIEDVIRRANESYYKGLCNE